MAGRANGRGRGRRGGRGYGDGGPAPEQENSGAPAPQKSKLYREFGPSKEIQIDIPTMNRAFDVGKLLFVLTAVGGDIVFEGTPQGRDKTFEAGVKYSLSEVKDREASLEASKKEINETITKLGPMKRLYKRFARLAYNSYDDVVPVDDGGIYATSYEEYKSRVKADSRKLHDFAEDKEKVLLGLKEKVASKAITKAEIASVATIRNEMDQSIRDSDYLRDYLEMKSDSFRIFLGDRKGEDGKWEEAASASSEGEEGGG